MTIKQKISWILFSFSVVPLILLIWLHSASFFSESRANAQAHLTDVAEIAAVSLNDTLVAALRDARALSATIWRHADDGQALADDLMRFAIHYPYFRELAWVQPSGVVVMSTIRSHTGRHIEETHADLAEFFVRALAQPMGLQVSDLDDMPPARRPSVAGGPADAGKLTLKFLLRSDDARGAARGVLVAELHSEALLSQLREASRHIPGKQPTLLFNQHGELLLSTGAGRLLEQHTLLTQGTSKDSMIVGSATMPGLPNSGKAAWSVVVAAPLELVTASARRTLEFTLVLMLGMIAFSILATLYLARRVGHRISMLTDGTQRMGLGEFSHRLPAQTADELGALAMAFNGMAEKIESLLDNRERAMREQQALAVSLENRGAELQAALMAMQRQNDEILLRNELGDLLQSCIGLDEARAVVERYLPRLFPTAAGAVYLVSSAKTEAVEAAVRWGEPLPAETVLPTECWALRRGKTYLVANSELSLLCGHVPSLNIGASICVPLSAQGEVLGLLHINFGKPGATIEARLDEQQRLAEAVAAQVGMALANLNLREKLQQQSTHDALTGLYNRRFLESALPRELSKARRGSRPLAVFMLDVDHFKNFNDTHGHNAGDEVLKELGRALHENCRQVDIACRFGGEEFTILLPDADERAAREWAERLMERVRTMEVKAGSQILPKITVSMGLALMPAHGENPETLLRASDRALYEAKHAGRDRLMVS